jgi:hypothetical protein
VFCVLRIPVHCQVRIWNLNFCLPKKSCWNCECVKYGVASQQKLKFDIREQANMNERSQENIIHYYFLFHHHLESQSAKERMEKTIQSCSLLSMASLLLEYLLFEILYFLSLFSMLVFSFVALLPRT